MEEDLFRKGKVVKFFPQSGYGFIRDSGGRQIYFHLDEVRFIGEKKKRSQIKEGLEVGFDVSRTAKGMRATHLKFYPSGLSSNPAEKDGQKKEGSPVPEALKEEMSAPASPPTPPEPVPENNRPDKKAD